MCFIWWLDYSPFYFYNVSFPGETECSVRKNIGWDSSVFIRSCEKWMFCTRLNLVQMLVWTWMNSRTWILVCSHLWRTSCYVCVETEGQDQPLFFFLKSLSAVILVVFGMKQKWWLWCISVWNGFSNEKKCRMRLAGISSNWQGAGEDGLLPSPRTRHHKRKK